MKNFSSQFWNTILGSVRGFDSTRQLAAGIVLGMLIGIVPKDSLSVYMIGAATILSTANLFCAAISGLSFTWIGTLIDPYSHSAGNAVLGFQPMQGFYAWASELPVVPWTRFDNTVVTGSLVIGLGLAIPLYFMSRTIINRLRPQFATTLMDIHFVRWLVGSPAHRDEAEIVET